MRLLRTAGVLVLLAAACRHARPAEAPAVLTHPTAASAEALREAVSRALGGVPVTLAGDALTGTSLLLVGRRPMRDPEGRLLEGRELGKPDRFHLVKAGSECVLVHEGTGERVVLRDTTCELPGR